ncbi:hypothetical protein JCM11641_006863 [Rhodosporidiobolus odoratus]
MSTPVQRSLLTDLDPLQPRSPSTPARLVGATSSDLSPSPARLPPSPVRPSTSSAPLSFKRRTSSSTNKKMADKAAGFLGGLLSRNQQQQSDADLVPQLPSSVADSSSSHSTLQQGAHLSLPRGSEPGFRRTSESGYSNAITSDGEDEEDEEEVTKSITGGTAGRTWKRRWTGQTSQGGRSSFAFAGGAGRPRRSVSGNFLMPGKAGGGADGDGGESAVEALPMTATPLPKIPLIVLSIAMFGEFLSASVCSPFLFFMVESFGVGSGPNGGGESAVSLWTGVVASVFFLSQCLCAFPWVSIADKHGRRAVLLASLVGNGLSVMAFGTSKNLGTAITTRLAMGLFNGAVGVARSAVNDITDESNRSSAYTILGLVWGLGGIVGSILGGVLEHPVSKYPAYFGESELFATYPYLLPCLVAGSVTLAGGFLSLFLTREGGQRTGAIHLPTEKDVEVAASTLAKLKDAVLTLLSNLYSRISRRPPVHLSPETGNVSLHPSSAAIPPLVSPAPSPSVTDALSERNTLSDRRSSMRQYGTAYGYRQPSQAGEVGGMRIPSMRRRGPRTFSVATANRFDPDNEVSHSFAERLLLANSQAVFGLSDVFLAKAAADDQRSALEYEEGSIIEREDDEESRIEGTDMDLNSEYGDVGFGSAPPSMDDLRGEAARQDEAAAVPRPSSPSVSVYQRPPMLQSPIRERTVSYAPTPSVSRLRRGSATSSRPFSIFSNSGLAPENIASSAGQLSSAISVPPRADESGFEPMAAIPETRPASIVEHAEGQEIIADAADGESLVWQLPLAVIAGYGLVGLHSTTCDQVFGSFLVTKVASGGLGLSAQHYSVLVALMFFFQLVWNFRFYPAVGPPNGPLSHLAMFRLGLLLYIPVYLLFPELRGLIIVEGEDFLVMSGMVVLSAIRYLANACAYTSVMVLINVMTPVELVPLANGLAQSSISLARFIGPLLGGSVFAASIADGPSAHTWPFNYAAGFVLSAVLCFAGFLFSWRIK